MALKHNISLPLKVTRDAKSQRDVDTSPAAVLAEMFTLVPKISEWNIHLASTGPGINFSLCVRDNYFS